MLLTITWSLRGFTDLDLNAVEMHLGESEGNTGMGTTCKHPILPKLSIPLDSSDLHLNLGENRIP